MLSNLKTFLSTQRQEIEVLHRHGVSGSRVVLALSDLADRVIRRGITETGHAAIESGAWVALGGYGRQELSPSSDIDLMFLYPSKAVEGTAASESLRLLWDIGYKVGHSVRTIEACVELARQDLIIATSLLDARLILGSEALFTRFREKYFTRVIHRDRADFLARLLQKPTEDQAFGLLEPDLKQGAGGLREIHRIKWVASICYGTNQFSELHRRGLLSDVESVDITTTQDFLWRVRNHLHFRTGKPTDLMTVEMQEEIAAWFHFSSRREWMRAFYIQTGRVAEIAERFIADAREEGSVGRWGRLRRQWNQAWGFSKTHVGDGDPSDKEASDSLEKDEAVLRAIFSATASKHPIPVRQLEAIRQKSDRERERPVTPEAVALFRSLFSKPGHIAETLRMMHRTHFLWRFVPEFSWVDHLVQESRSHVYTVDEHTFRAIEEAERFALDDGPIGIIYNSIQQKECLHLALLLHDLGKGQEGNHSEIGARITQSVAERLGYHQEEIALLIFLVNKHLLFSEVAFYRDFSNEPILVHFAKAVARPETLKTLLVLTVADMCAVAPGILTAWKQGLLLDLYREALAILTGEERGFFATQQTSQWMTDIRQAVLGKYPEVWLNETLDALSPRYVQGTPLNKMVMDIEKLFHLLVHPIQVEVMPVPNSEMTEYTLYTYDTIIPGLFSKMTGLLAAKGLAIQSVRAFTHANGTIVDTFHTLDTDYVGAPPAKRIDDIVQTIQKVLTGQETVESLFEKGNRFQVKNVAVLPPTPVRIELDNDSSDLFTIIDIFAPDRRGLLYVIANALFDLNLIIHSAKIATPVDEIVDVFYVQDKRSEKVIAPEMMESIKQTLRDRIERYLKGL